MLGGEAVTVVTVNSKAFWTGMLCSREGAQCFVGTYHLHLQGQKASKQETSRSRHEAQLEIRCDTGATVSHGNGDKYILHLYLQ